jgi:hypothetical protein
MPLRGLGDTLVALKANILVAVAANLSMGQKDEACRPA